MNFINRSLFLTLTVVKTKYCLGKSSTDWAHVITLLSRSQDPYLCKPFYEGLHKVRSDRNNNAINLVIKTTEILLRLYIYDTLFKTVFPFIFNEVS